MPEGTVTATRVGSKQSTDPKMGNAQAKKSSRISRKQLFLRSPVSDYFGMGKVVYLPWFMVLMGWNTRRVSKGLKY